MRLPDSALANLVIRQASLLVLADTRLGCEFGQQHSLTELALFVSFDRWLSYLLLYCSIAEPHLKVQFSLELLPYYKKLKYRLHLVGGFNDLLMWIPAELNN